MTSADKRFYYMNPFVAGMETEYTYDMAGNRLTKQQGGSGSSYEGYGTRTTNYGTANALNQYVSITHPYSGANTLLDVSGQRAYAGDVITVNGQEASYQSAYYSTPSHAFRKELGVAPTTNQRYLDVTVSSAGNGVLDSGKMYVPPVTENLTYDADGNLLQDARWIYRWDAENRLVSQTPTISGSAAGVGTQTSIYHTYDGLSRRVCRRQVQDIYVSNGSGGAVFSQTQTFRRAFTYDAWNMVQSLDSGGTAGNPGGTDGDLTHANTAASRLSFVWGPDIGSQTHGHTSWQQAGGVGGLIAVLGTTTTNCQFPLMDRLGNIMGYRRAVSGTPTVLDATYEYDAFGREVRSTGPASDLMPYRFSTKYTDADSGLVYYGYRFYDSDRGRWVSRDPIGGAGGVNLYAIIENSLIGGYDYLGLVQGVNIIDQDFKVGDCGSFYWKANWQLNVPSASGGLVIQKVRVTGGVTNCSGGTSSLGPKIGPGGHYPYWESWTIAAGATKTGGSSPDDTLAIDKKHLKGYPKTRGKLTWTTTTNYYDGAGAAATHGLAPYVPVDPLDKHPSGGLPYSPSEPTGLPLATPRNTTRTFTVDWNCCNANRCDGLNRSSFDRDDKTVVQYPDKSN